jgi:hypothetical protein
MEHLRNPGLSSRRSWISLALHPGYDDFPGQLRTRSMTDSIGHQSGSEKITIRTERSIYFFLGIFGLIITLVSINTENFWSNFMLFLLAWSILFLWLATYKITIDQNVLSYSVLLKGTVSVRRDDIVSAEVLLGRFEHAIVIRRQLDSSIVINTKPFSKADLRIVIRFLSERIVGVPDWF